MTPAYWRHIKDRQVSSIILPNNNVQRKRGIGYRPTVSCSFFFIKSWSTGYGSWHTTAKDVETKPMKSIVVDSSYWKCQTIKLELSSHLLCSLTCICCHGESLLAENLCHISHDHCDCSCWKASSLVFLSWAVNDLYVLTFNIILCYFEVL